MSQNQRKMTKLLLKILLVLKTCQAIDSDHFLICPFGYKPTSQAWYAEAPDTVQMNTLNLSSIDYLKVLTTPQSSFKPTTFSVCIICTNATASPEVELCIGHKSLRKNNLVYERRPANQDHSGTLVWWNTHNLVGIKIPSSEKDLLSMLKNIQPVTWSSFHSLYLNCPYGYQLVNLEERSPQIEGQTQRPCIICSNGHYLYSCCMTWNQPKDKYQSILLPGLSTVEGKSCPKKFHSGRDGCQLNVDELVTGKQASCGVHMNPETFLSHYKEINGENLKLYCPFNPTDGE